MIYKVDMAIWRDRVAGSDAYTFSPEDVETLLDEVERLRDVVARVADAEHWEQVSAALRDADGWPKFEGWKR